MTGIKRPKKRLKKDKVAAEAVVAAAESTIPEHSEIKSSDVPKDLKLARDVNMFKGWLLGKTYEQLAKENDLSGNQVYFISKKNKWRELRSQLRARHFAEALDEVRSVTVNIQKILSEDIGLIAKDVKAKLRMLNKEERDHLRSMYDRLLKEIRLEDGKPTELGGSSVQVEIVLPVGAKRFGVIPPDSKTKIVEATVIEDKEIDLEAIQDELQDEIE